MSPPVPIPIPLTNTSQTQIIPRIKNDDQLPDKAILRTVSSFIKSYPNTLSQSTTSLPLQHTRTSISTTPITSSPLTQTQIQTQPPTLIPTTPKESPPEIKMAHTTTTVTTRPSLFARLRGAKTNRRTYEKSTLGGTHRTHNHTHATGTTTTTGARRQRTWGRSRRAGGVAAQPVHHHHRKPSVGDKISGAMMKLRGSLTRRPGLKVCFIFLFLGG